MAPESRGNGAATPPIVVQGQKRSKQMDFTELGYEAYKMLPFYTVEQTAGHRSTNFGTHMHEHLLADFDPNRQRL